MSSNFAARVLMKSKYGAQIRIHDTPGSVSVVVSVTEIFVECVIAWTKYFDKMS